MVILVLIDKPSPMKGTVGIIGKQRNPSGRHDFHRAGSLKLPLPKTSLPFTIRGIGIRCGASKSPRLQGCGAGGSPSRPFTEQNKVGAYCQCRIERSHEHRSK
jgi:hypothetical protein